MTRHIQISRKTFITIASVVMLFEGGMFIKSSTRTIEFPGTVLYLLLLSPLFLGIAATLGFTASAIVALAKSALHPNGSSGRPKAVRSERLLVATVIATCIATAVVLLISNQNLRSPTWIGNPIATWYTIWAASAIVTLAVYALVDRVVGPHGPKDQQGD